MSEAAAAVRRKGGPRGDFWNQDARRLTELANEATRRGAGTEELERLLAVATRIPVEYIRKRQPTNFYDLTNELLERQTRLSVAAEAYPLLFQRPHGPQTDLLRRPSRLKAAFAANRGGKTEWLCTEALTYSTGLVPLALAVAEEKYGPEYGIGIVPAYNIGNKVVRRKDGRWSMPVPNHGWIVSQKFGQSREVIEPMLWKLLPKSMQGNFNKQERLLILPNGSTIGLRSVDQGREAFQGTARHWIGYDEEPDEDVRNECQMRLIDTAGVELFSMTPLRGLTWVHDQIHDVALEGSDPDVYMRQWSMFDNPYIDRKEIERRLKKLTNPIEIMVRIYGAFMGFDGLPVFDQMNLASRVSGLPRPVAVDGNLTTWKRPEPNHEYVFGCDVAEGEGGEHDFSVVEVLDRHSFEQVAEYRSATIDAAALADVVETLGVRYNNAYGYVESNNHGHTTISHLRDRYPFLCQQQTFDSTSRAWANKIGWRTDRKTKPLAVRDLFDAVHPSKSEHTPIVLNSKTAIKEMLTFVKKDADRKKYAASGSKKDDCVMALALAVQASHYLGAPEPLASPEPERPADPDRYTHMSADVGEEGEGTMHPILGGGWYGDG